MSHQLSRDMGLGERPLPGHEKHSIQAGTPLTAPFLSFLYVSHHDHVYIVFLFIACKMCLRYLDNGLLLDDGSSSNAGHCSATSGSDAAARCHASQGPQPELSQGKYDITL